MRTPVCLDSGPAAGTRRVACMEFGRWMDAPTAHERDAQFELRRVAGQTAFSINGRRAYVSPNMPTGPMLVGAALYRAQDRVL